MFLLHILLVVVGIILVLTGVFGVIGSSYLIGTDRRLRKLDPLMGIDLRNIGPFLVRMPSRGHVVLVISLVLIGGGIYLIFTFIKALIT